MLDLLGGIFSLFVQTSPKVELLQKTNWSPWLDETWVQSVIAPSPDPAAQLAVQQHLGALSTLGFSVSNQAVWMQTGHQVLAEHQATTPLSAASLTKVATTLAALTTWGTDHQFETQFSTNAPIENGVVQGDVWVVGGGDPFFVWEEAIAVGNALNQAGIKAIKGDLVIAGYFAMNFHDNPQTSGNALKQALNASLWSNEIETQYRNLPPETVRPSIQIQGTVRLGSPDPQARLILRHQSMPLVDLLKAMNVYSNNFMAQMLADGLGGATEVTQQVLKITRLPASEVQIINGSGLGTENRLSARAVTTMLLATHHYLQARNLTIADVYPIVGRDGGTLKWRETPDGTVVKTGTLNEVSSLAGVLPTRDRGLVWFTIINLGGGELGKFHSQQDLLLTQVQQGWGAAALASVQPTARHSQGANKLGAAKRNQLAEEMMR
ncbi:MAG: D-alanyl-D-alanine carboxypeptidase [Elainella sp. Prado103]|nr:D-alanyl-D-alanine carboxypeptidase [Elainella sp. Prado103]